MYTPSHTIHFTFPFLPSYTSPLSLPPFIHLSSFPSSPHTPLLFPSTLTHTFQPTFPPVINSSPSTNCPSSITLPLPLPLPLPPPPLITPHTHTHTHTPSTLQRLEDEGNTNQKLLSERANAENKIKTLEEQMTLSEDNIAKV